jgi:hypothetical protein
MFKNIKTAEQVAAEEAQRIAEAELARSDWKGFFKSLKETTIFQDLRDQSRTDISTNALSTELRLSLGEAALGLVDIETIQSLLEELWPGLSEVEQDIIVDLIVENHIPLQNPLNA